MSKSLSTSLVLRMRCSRSHKQASVRNIGSKPSCRAPVTWSSGSSHPGFCSPLQTPWARRLKKLKSTGFALAEEGNHISFLGTDVNPEQVLCPGRGVYWGPVWHWYKVPGSIPCLNHASTSRLVFSAPPMSCLFSTSFSVMTPFVFLKSLQVTHLHFWWLFKSPAKLRRRLGFRA